MTNLELALRRVIAVDVLAEDIVDKMFDIVNKYAEELGDPEDADSVLKEAIREFADTTDENELDEWENLAHHVTNIMDVGSFGNMPKITKDKVRLALKKA